MRPICVGSREGPRSRQGVAENEEEGRGDAGGSKEGMENERRPLSLLRSRKRLSIRMAREIS